MMKASRPLGSIGGGPSAMTVPIEAVRAGLNPTLIDEASAVGGQVYRRLPQAFQVDHAHGLGQVFARGERLRQELADVADCVEFLSKTAVLGVRSNREILWTRRECSALFTAERLIVAGGVHDHPSPFPGWTLPRVMTAGWVQTIFKIMRVRPGRRAIVADGTVFAVDCGNNRIQKWRPENQ